jgi:hypothetical protein
MTQLRCPLCNFDWCTQKYAMHEFCPLAADFSPKTRLPYHMPYKLITKPLNSYIINIEITLIQWHQNTSTPSQFLANIHVKSTWPLQSTRVSWQRSSLADHQYRKWTSSKLVTRVHKTSTNQERQISNGELECKMEFIGLEWCLLHLCLRKNRSAWWALASSLLGCYQESYVLGTWNIITRISIEM